MELHLNLYHVLGGAAAIFMAGLAGGVWNPILQPLLLKIKAALTPKQHMTVEAFREFEALNTSQHEGVKKLLAENTLELGEVTRQITSANGQIIEIRTDLSGVKEGVQFLKDLKIAEINQKSGPAT